MPIKTISVQFSEQSKGAVADVKVEYSGPDCPSNEDILKEARELFAEAYKTSTNVSMQKAR